MTLKRPTKKDIKDRYGDDLEDDELVYEILMDFGRAFKDSGSHAEEMALGEAVKNLLNVFIKKK